MAMLPPVEGVWRHQIGLGRKYKETSSLHSLSSGPPHLFKHLPKTEEAATSRLVRLSERDSPFTCTRAIHLVYPHERLGGHAVIPGGLLGDAKLREQFVAFGAVFGLRDGVLGVGAFQMLRRGDDGVEISHVFIGLAFLGGTVEFDFGKRLVRRLGPLNACVVPHPSNSNTAKK